MLRSLPRDFTCWSCYLATGMPVPFNRARIRTLRREFEVIAFRMLRGSLPNVSLAVRDRRFRAWCGVSSSVIAMAWDLLSWGTDLPEAATEERFLWAIIVLKSYDTEEINAGHVGGVDEGTFRIWSWWFVEALFDCESDVVSVSSPSSSCRRRCLLVVAG